MRRFAKDCCGGLLTELLATQPRICYQIERLSVCKFFGGGKVAGKSGVKGLTASSSGSNTASIRELPYEFVPTSLGL